MNIVLAADMHLKPGANPEQRQKLMDFLEVCRGFDSLILVGDTFNCWYEKRGRYSGDYQEILDIFAAAVADGLEINIISGNRDFVFSKGSESYDPVIYQGFTKPQSQELSAIAAAGIKLRGWSYEFESGGMRYHCAHGDIFCIDNVWHQLLRYLLMGNPARVLSRFVPIFLVNCIFIFFNAYNRRAGGNNYEIYDFLRQQDEALVPLIDSGVDHIICGHLHQYITRNIEGAEKKGILTVLPCWAGGEYALLTDNTLVIKKCSYS